MECPKCGHEMSGYDQLEKVWIILDSMDRFQGTFGCITRAQNRLLIKHGEVEFKLMQDGLSTRMATCADGTIYRIERHTPN